MRDLQISLSGAVAQEQRLSVVANNLANANTVGFKKDQAAFETFLADSIRRPAQAGLEEAGLPPVNMRGTGERAYMRMAGTFTDLSQGTLRPTNNPLDLAIEGPGFFVVETPQGERFTRAGNFQRNAEGALATQDGHPVLGRSGEIRVEGDFTVADDGTVLSGGQPVGQLRLVRFDDPRSLEKAGANLFHAASGRPSDVKEEDGIRVRQHVIEQSNVNMIDEMTRLIATERAYQMSAKALETIDRTYQQKIQMHLNG